MKVRDAEEALKLANDSRYGLSGSVFGEKQRAEQVARRVECGAINVNDVLVNYFASDVPMGGWKESGIGYRHGELGSRSSAAPSRSVITRFAGKREPTWYPWTRARRGLVGSIAQAFSARDLKRRPRPSRAEGSVRAPGYRVFISRTRSSAGGSVPEGELPRGFFQR